MTETIDDPRIIRMRVLNPISTTSNPADVTAIGLAEMEICGSDAVISAIRSTPFEVDRQCTAADLAAAVLWPEPADVYVTWDLSRTRELVPPDASWFSPWIGIGRLMVQSGHDIVGKPAEAVARELHIGGELAMAPTDGTAASLGAAATALLTTLLYGQMGMNLMLRQSLATTRPLCPLPGFDDAAGWAAMARADLDWVVDHKMARELAGLAPDPAFDDHLTHRATRELNRRRIFAHRS